MMRNPDTARPLNHHRSPHFPLLRFPDIIDHGCPQEILARVAALPVIFAWLTRVVSDHFSDFLLSFVSWLIVNVACPISLPLRSTWTAA
ncbi:hypothetical protein [Streptomyces sp. NPDC057545]|uniref:hypothetical protein n=1 Tax=Streptomyces sp. NPDC057545 TaxID=3346164 RepID=UPI0036CFF34C